MDHRAWLRWEAQNRAPWMKTDGRVSGWDSLWAKPGDKNVQPCKELSSPLPSLLTMIPMSSQVEVEEEEQWAVSHAPWLWAAVDCDAKPERGFSEKLFPLTVMDNSSWLLGRIFYLFFLNQDLLQERKRWLLEILTSSWWRVWDRIGNLRW